jgi:hypothetical protein
MSVERDTTPSDLTRLRALCRGNAIVARVFDEGGSVVDALWALSEERIRLLGELADLNARVGQRIRLPDGRVLVHRPPDDMLPLHDFSKGILVTDSKPKNHDTITLAGVEYVRIAGGDDATEASR